MGDTSSITKAFEKMVLTISPDLLRLILERCELDSETLAKALEKAAWNNSCELVGILIEKCPPMGRTYGYTSQYKDYKKNVDWTHLVIDNAMKEAADDGRLDMVKVLTPKCGSFACDILNRAVLYDQWEVAKVLLKMCEEQYLKEPRMKHCATKMMEQAAADDDVEMALRILKKFGEVDIEDALQTAVENNSLSILNLLAEKSDLSCVVDAFVTAAEKKQIEMVNTPLVHIDEEETEEALEKAALSGKVGVSRLLLQHCNPDAYKLIFQKAATSNNVGVVQLLLDQMDPCSINRALTSAAGRGYMELVKILLDKYTHRRFQPRLKLQRWKETVTW